MSFNSNSRFKLLVKNAKQVAVVSSGNQLVLRGKEMGQVAVMPESSPGINGCGAAQEGVSIVVNLSGMIEDIGCSSALDQKYSHATFDHVLDVSGMCVLPGLVDGHTHPVWAGDRVHEFAMKIAGASYMDVHKAGGGIGFTVEHTRAASEDELYNLLQPRLEGMLQAGTTLAECKSGYGLETATEMKMLRVLERARRELPIEISSTFCGAHSVPIGQTAEEATEDVINKQLPELQNLIETGDIQVDNIDVFCEKGVFDVDQSRRILQAGLQMGLSINFHGEELTYLGAAEMGSALKATAISHLEEISDAGITAMAEAGSVAVVLPTTAYILKLTPPPVRKMIENGVAVALGSDFNPNAFCLSMPLAMHLACVNLGMTMDEALVAATINAAASLGKSRSHGSLEVGKVGDMIVIDAPRWEHLIYQLGNHERMIKHVIKRGDVIQ
ncbi:probable imidazolonepropionase [Acanthaster planci]|uniref:Probable imidazolonepropionase n=1 Tax=Acanthaster planci TaxID=133434 RepID=A0A8B8A1H5_ACAPL|nr:probable imidazolonepropionase [Acanthaster planci]